MDIKINKINILIIGAGKAGSLVAQNISQDVYSSFNIVGFIDDSEEKQGLEIEGINVVGRIDDIPTIVKNYNVKELLICLPSQRGSIIRKIITVSTGLDLNYKILPRISEVIIQDFNKDYMRYVKKIETEDFLGGYISKEDQEEVGGYARDKVIFITGAAGSIGSELSKQIAAYKVRKAIFFDWWENGMFDLQNYIQKNYPELDCEFIIGNIRDRGKVDALLKKYKPHTVFHAAAYKHVPLMESNAYEAIKNNIFGTKNLAELAIKNNVNKFVLVSTDKAVNPTNVMGATKRAAEKIIHVLSEHQSSTVFCVVRFGNVINSNGSAIPTFEKQIESGGPVTVTHAEITRFFMTISEAVHLILKAWIMGENNDLFVLDMGEPVKIMDLAKLLITVRGYEPQKDILIKITGLRPGEKLYEEVLVKEEETISTKYDKIYRTKNYMNFDKLNFLKVLMFLEEHIQEDGLNTASIKGVLKKMIPTYTPESN